MFDIGFLELIVVAVIALIILGPERMPQAVRTLGLWVGKAKKGFNSVKNEINRELQAQELQQSEQEKSSLEDQTPLQVLQNSIDIFSANLEQSVEKAQDNMKTSK